MNHNNCFIFIFHTFHIIIQQYIATYLITIDGVPQSFQHLIGIAYASYFKLSLFHRFISVFFDTQNDSSAYGICE